MPHRFARRWLAFDESRPVRPAVARRLVVAILAMLVLAGTLAFLTAR